MSDERGPNPTTTTAATAPTDIPPTDTAPTYISVEAGRLRRRTVLFATLAVVLAAAAVAAWFHAGRTRHDVTERRLVPSPAAAMPGSCPPQRLCEIDAPVRPAVLALIRAGFGAGAVRSSSAVVDAVSLQPYLEHETVRTPAGASLEVTARCVTGAAVATSSMTTPSPPIGPVERTTAVAGTQGCSVAVTVRAAAGVIVAWSAIERLAHAPTLQLR